ncbi:MAG: glycosyltransferase family 4 protein [Magnetococcales bacterium]|nr:glycosyltransferase family 4 protein [Magnetococcales bacterium]
MMRNADETMHHPPFRGSVALFYHFFHPDDVVSARLFTDLAKDLAQRGWQVTVHTSNRLWSNPHACLATGTEHWAGVQIIRTARPGLEQGRYFPRLLNALWLMLGWTRQVLRSSRPDLFLVGTDPQFSQLLLPLLRLAAPRARIVWWCFDLYPEAIAADQPGGWLAALARGAARLLGPLYRLVDLAVDIGPCMRARLATHKWRRTPLTLTPWALVEPATPTPPDPELRLRLFGPGCRLALLYSGTLGRAHDFTLFLELMRRLRRIDPGIRLLFSCRGNRLAALRAAVQPEDDNILFAPFADEKELAARLAAADIHLLSLNPEWDGIVVPSKFFGSLATGRPLLYAGSATSSIGQWIDTLDVGFRVEATNMDAVVAHLLALAQNPTELERLQHDAFTVYHRHFSRRLILERWDDALKKLLGFRS